MKNKFSLLVGLASLAAIVGVQAQSAVTDPVGYITTSIAGVSAGSAGISYYGASLVNKTEVKLPAVSGAASTVTFAANSFTAGQFGLNAVLQPRFYAEISTVGNANEGIFSDIVSNTTNTLTFFDPIGGLITPGVTITIRAHHTFDSLFGDTAATCKLRPGVDLNSADEVQLFNPETQAPVSYYFNTDDLGVVGWVNAKTGAAAGVEVIAPGVGVKVVRRVGSASSVVTTGYVKTGRTILPVETGINIISSPRAVGSAFRGSNSGLVASGLTGGVDLNSADEVFDLVNGLPTSYFFSTDDLSPGWQPSDPVLREGTAVKITRRAAPFNWVIPAETIAN